MTNTNKPNVGKVDAPKVDAPKVDAPKVDAPLSDTARAILAITPPPLPVFEPIVSPLNPLIGAGGKTRTSYPDAGVIELLVDENPKKPNTDTRARFALIFTGMTIRAYSEACAKLEGLNPQKAAGTYRRDMSWAAERNHLAIWPAGTSAAYIKAFRQHEARAAAQAQAQAAAAMLATFDETGGRNGGQV